VAFLKHRIAKLTRAKLTLLSFGYVPSELQTPPKPTLEDTVVVEDSVYAQRPIGMALSRLYSLRPQTLAFSLCDSPIGLLASLLDIIHTRHASTTPLASRSRSRSRSPFLSPVELEMQEQRSRTSDNNLDIIHEANENHESPETPFSPRDSEPHAINYSWSPTEMLNWTMMQWLPGPEASLRWMQRAHMDTSPSSLLSTRFSDVPLGISTFHNSKAASTPLLWGSAFWRIGWVKRNQHRAASQPAWEAPDLLVLDMRECFGTFLSQGLVNFPFQAS
jgi:hypothetical protein